MKCFIILLLTLSSSLFGASNIYFVYGDLGLNSQAGDPYNHWSTNWRWKQLEQKGYHTHNIYDVTPETLLLILQDPNTLGVFYIGHAIANEKELKSSIANPSVLEGNNWVPLNKETIALAKKRLALHGWEYKAAASVKFIHLGTCYGSSCLKTWLHELNLSGTEMVTFEGQVHPISGVISDYVRGNAAHWIDSLPNTNGPKVNGWQEVNHFYANTHSEDMSKIESLKQKENNSRSLSIQQQRKSRETRVFQNCGNLLTGINRKQFENKKNEFSEAETTYKKME